MADGGTSPVVLHILSIITTNVLVHKGRGPKKGKDNCKKIKDNIRAGSGVNPNVIPLSEIGLPLAVVSDLSNIVGALRGLAPISGVK